MTKHEIMLHAVSLKGRSRTSTNKLLSHILTAWDKMDQGVIDTTVRQWSTLLRMC